jgi:type I restriction enzyme R subunit
MISKLGAEKSAVQNTLVSYVQEAMAQYTASSGRTTTLHLGWQEVLPGDALAFRGGERGLVFRDVFLKQLRKLNDFLDETLAEEIIKKIEQIPANIEGNLLAWEYLKGLRSIFVPSEKRERNVRFLDAENPDNNVFQVTKEFTFHNGNREIRLDVVFLINGVPVFFVETKSAHKIGGMGDALDQIKKYHRECPELLAILQIYAMTHIIQFYYSPTWNLSPKGIFNWKEESSGSYEMLVKTFFDRTHILHMVHDFILFTRQDDELKKVVLRPHQMRAVEKIVIRCADQEKKHGLIWHTQGSGKTYTMIVAAQKILKNPIFENPTVVMLYRVEKK